MWKDVPVSSLTMSDLLLDELTKLEPGQSVQVIVGKRRYLCSNNLAEREVELCKRCSRCDNRYVFNHTCKPIPMEFNDDEQVWKGLGVIPYNVLLVDESLNNRSLYGLDGIELINTNGKRVRQKTARRKHRKKIDNKNILDVVTIKHVQCK